MSIISYVNFKLSVHTRPLRAKGSLTKPNASCLYPVWDGDECCIVQYVGIQESVGSHIGSQFPFSISRIMEWNSAREGLVS